MERANIVPITITKGRPKLLDQVRTAIRVRHYSLRTEQSYIHWVKRFIFFHNKRHPAMMGEAEVTAFLNHLAVERQVSASTQNQALSALLFLFEQVLGKELEWLNDLNWVKRPARLPVSEAARMRLARQALTRMPVSSDGVLAPASQLAERLYDHPRARRRE